MTPRKKKRPRPPRRKWTHRQIAKSEFLSAVSTRLNNDVGPYLALVRDTYTSTGRAVGFWALARMIFPVIEAVAQVIYRSAAKTRPGPKERREVRLLRNLGLDYPNLVWEMYRHTLMHNDEMASAFYRGRRVNWEIRIGGGHLFRDGRISIDMEAIYNEFVAFLAREITNSPPTQVWVKDTFSFSSTVGKLTRQEMLKLGIK